MRQQRLSVRTEGRGSYEVTHEVAGTVADAGVQTGLCSIFLHHTSASLIICENADPAVRRDLDRYFEHLVPDGDPMFEHDQEGPDDMPAHIRNILTQSALIVPITDGRLALGTWQGIYVWEHRYSGSTRRVTVTILAGGG